MRNSIISNGKLLLCKLQLHAQGTALVDDLVMEIERLFKLVLQVLDSHVLFSLGATAFAASLVLLALFIQLQLQINHLSRQSSADRGCRHEKKGERPGKSSGAESNF